MKTISKRELNQQTAQVLDGVKAGEPVLITERGVARWRIEAVDAGFDAIARLRAEGRIIPPKANPAPWLNAGRRCELAARRTPADVDALLDELRGDR